jgi:hypothetical protein
LREIEEGEFSNYWRVLNFSLPLSLLSFAIEPNLFASGDLRRE